MPKRAGGREALNLSENRAFREAVETAERDVYDQWVDENDINAREKLHAEGRALRRVTRCLERASASDVPVREVV